MKGSEWMAEGVGDINEGCVDGMLWRRFCRAASCRYSIFWAKANTADGAVTGSPSGLASSWMAPKLNLAALFLL